MNMQDVLEMAHNNGFQECKDKILEILEEYFNEDYIAVDLIEVRNAVNNLKCGD